MTDAPKQTIKSKLRKGGLLAAIVVPFVGGFEGLRQTAYPDPASHGRPWTICYGHTAGVTRGERESVAQCKELLLADLDKEAGGLDTCIHVPTTNGQDVALLSLAHNIGVGGVCRSSVTKAFNEGRYTDGCNDLLRFNRAAGIVFPGLTRRREAERRLCLGE